jgi:hypothetical protein
MIIRHQPMLRLFLTAVAVMALAGCKEITTSTRIFPDGSWERTIEIPGDSSPSDSTFVGSFPMPVDSTWKITQKIDTTQVTQEIKSGKKTESRENRTAVAAKRFSKVAELNRLYLQMGKDPLKAAVEVQLQRKFRWFNTFYKYKETYKASTPFKKVPITDYLSPKELALYYIKEDTLKLDKKMEQWLARSFFEEFFTAMIEASDSIPVPGLDTGVLQKSKESLFAALMKLDEQKSGEDLFKSDKIMRFLGGFYHNSGVAKWSSPIDRAMNVMMKKQEFLMDLDGYSYVNRVVMPGLILDTNAPSVEGGTVEWKLKSNRFYWEDYVMRVESRAVNRWAIWVTAVLLLAILGALAVTLVRKK